MEPKVMSSKSNPGCPALHRWQTPNPGRCEEAAFGPRRNVLVNLPADASLASKLVAKKHGDFHSRLQKMI